MYLLLQGLPVDETMVLKLVEGYCCSNKYTYYSLQIAVCVDGRN
jgi:hypothetical protein